MAKRTSLPEWMILSDCFYTKKPRAFKVPATMTWTMQSMFRQVLAYAKTHKLEMSEVVLSFENEPAMDAEFGET